MKCDKTVLGKESPQRSGCTFVSFPATSDIFCVRLSIPNPPYIIIIHILLTEISWKCHADIFICHKSALLQDLIRYAATSAKVIEPYCIQGYFCVDKLVNLKFKHIVCRNTSKFICLNMSPIEAFIMQMKMLT